MIWIELLYRRRYVFPDRHGGRLGAVVAAADAADVDVIVIDIGRGQLRVYDGRRLWRRRQHECRTDLVFAAMLYSCELMMLLLLGHVVLLYMMLLLLLLLMML